MKKILFLLMMTALLALQAGAQTTQLPGDLNGDNEVNISDINLLINAISTGNGEAAYDLNSDGAINISDLSALVEIAMAVTPEADFDIDGEHATGWWIVLIDAEGNHVWEQIKHQESHYGYDNCLSLDYGTYGEFYWDPELSPEENNKNRPNVPFCFVLDGVRYGPSISMQQPVIWCNYPGYYIGPYNMEKNLLIKNNKYFSLPVGRVIHYDISFDNETGEKYLKVAELYAGA